MQTVNIKPLSVNDAWQGRRFKTPKYKQYEQDLRLLLRPYSIPEGELKLMMQIGFSNRASDIDNPLKPFVDVLQKKYEFNDNRIYELHIKKIIVPRGDEFLNWGFEPCQ